MTGDARAGCLLSLGLFRKSFSVGPRGQCLPPCPARRAPLTHAHPRGPKPRAGTAPGAGSGENVPRVTPPKPKMRTDPSWEEEPR